MSNLIRSLAHRLVKLRLAIAGQTIAPPSVKYHYASHKKEYYALLPQIREKLPYYFPATAKKVKIGAAAGGHWFAELDDIKRYLKWDETNRMLASQYVNCTDYAIALVGRIISDWGGIHFGYVRGYSTYLIPQSGSLHGSILSPRNSKWYGKHAFCWCAAFEDGKMGIYFIEPQTDRVYEADDERYVPYELKAY